MSSCRFNSSDRTMTSWYFMLMDHSKHLNVRKKKLYHDLYEYIHLHTIKPHCQKQQSLEADPTIAKICLTLRIEAITRSPEGCQE